MSHKFFVCGQLTDEIPYTDNHVHTTYSDGHSTIDEYVAAALQKGMQSIVFTDHVNRQSTWFSDYIADVNRAKKKYQGQINILAGIEAKALNYIGEIDATEEMIKACDVVIGVVHRYPNPFGGMLEFTEVDGERAYKLEFEAAKGLLEKGEINILGHIGAMYETKYGLFPEELLKELIKVAQENGKIIELNGKYNKSLSKIIEYCRLYKPLVSLGSDAHDISEIGFTYERIKGLIHL